MENKITKCKKCLKDYPFISTDCDLCVDCVNKYPYFISFVEEGFVGVTDKIFGRVEVYTNKESNNGYAIDELRFCFTENQLKSKKYHEFREKWDFENVSEKTLEKIKKTIKKSFYTIY